MIIIKKTFYKTDERDLYKLRIKALVRLRYKLRDDISRPGQFMVERGAIGYWLSYSQNSNSTGQTFFNY